MRRRTLLGAGAAVAAVLAGTVSATFAQAADRPVPPRTERGSPVPALPEPGGDQPIGMHTMHLKVVSRADPWVPEEKRELMVSLWYPAEKPSGVPAPYMTAEESRQYVLANKLDQRPACLGPEVLSTVVTHSTVDAKPVRTREGLPLVVLSPGFGLPRATLSGVAEELAGRGYAVAAIGHNYEADGITFPDGHTTTAEARGVNGPDFPKMGGVRAKDVSFVLDELTEKGPAWKGGPRIDGDRVAMVGHSAGGFSTVPAMLADDRVKAGVNMDGNFHYPNDTPLGRPLLMLGKAGHVPGAETTWDETWTELTGWKRWLTVDGVGHHSFTDLAPLAKQLGIPLPGQSLDGDRVDAMNRTLVTAFVDRHLRGRGAPVLDGPSQQFPEVRYHKPGDSRGQPLPGREEP